MDHERQPATQGLLGFFPDATGENPVVRMRDKIDFASMNEIASQSTQIQGLC